METSGKTVVTVEATVNAKMEKVWDYWSGPEHIRQWCQASSDWHAPEAENDLREKGRFKTRMAARDGSAAFDFEGVYTKVKNHELIEYEMSDGRRVKITFVPQGKTVRIRESFEAESENPVEMQKAGWQAILDNFKSYVESN